MGGRWGGWGAVGGIKQTFKLKDSAVSDPDRHNSQGRPGLPSKSVWHSMQSH